MKKLFLVFNVSYWFLCFTFLGLSLKTTAFFDKSQEIEEEKPLKKNCHYFHHSTSPYIWILKMHESKHFISVYSNMSLLMCIWKGKAQYYGFMIN